MSALGEGTFDGDACALRLLRRQRQRRGR